MKGFTRLWKGLCYGFLAVMVCLTLVMNHYVATTLLDGDASELLNRGAVFAKERTPFPTDYYYTTEVSLLGVPFVFSPFFHLSGDWTVVRQIGTAAMQALYALSFVFLLRQSGVKWHICALSTGMLLTPFSTQYARIVLYHLYYIVYLAQAFLIFGFSLRLVRRRGKGAAWSACALGCLWLLAGMNGIRMMMILGVPMLLLGAVAMYRVLEGCRWHNGLTDAEGKRVSLLGAEETRFLAVAVAGCAVWLCGFAVYKHVILAQFHVPDMTREHFYPNLSAEYVVRTISGLLLSIGCRESTMPLLSARGVSFMAAVFSFAALFGMSLRRRHGSDKRSFSDQLTAGLLSSSVLWTFFVFVFTQKGGLLELYWVPCVSLMLPALAVELDALEDFGETIGRKALALGTAACLLFQGLYTTGFLTRYDIELDTYGGLGYRQMDTREQTQECVDFMLENEYTHAMIDYWNAALMTELSSGQLTVAPCKIDSEGTEGEKQIRLYRWGTSATAFLPENVPEKVILFVPADQAEDFEMSFDHSYLTFEGKTFCGFEVSRETLFEEYHILD